MEHIDTKKDESVVSVMVTQNMDYNRQTTRKMA